MRPTDTVRLVALVSQIAPSQTIDEFTPDAWHLVLGHLPFEECREAVIAVAQRERYISPADIVQEVKRARARGPQGADLVPDADPDDPRAYLAALRAGRMRHYADGAERRPLAEAMRAALPARASA